MSGGRMSKKKKKNLLPPRRLNSWIDCILEVGIICYAFRPHNKAGRAIALSRPLCQLTCLVGARWLKGWGADQKLQCPRSVSEQGPFQSRLLAPCLLVPSHLSAAGYMIKEYCSPEIRSILIFIYVFIYFISLNCTKNTHTLGYVYIQILPRKSTLFLCWSTCETQTYKHICTF